jgi:hypothetical protein
MEILIKENLRREKLMGKEFTNGQMEKSMMENGKMDSSMEMGCGKGWRQIPILENGNKAELKAMEYIFGKMGTGMKGNGSVV